ncbi:MAG: acetaldehyde dehydrogenase (acetylating) [Oscillospiraceae bacterium]|nr:acetaldehyde dehydrogenase (acetylating) [Oscillospiraceae bacterium]MDY4191694.1 acetaldehyde dehydrogenase (acetylating) [Oscillospiraceae bacterium]
MTLDRDLQSIQEVRDLIARAKAAQKQLAAFSQRQLDDICAAIAADCAAHAEPLAKMAEEETGFGRWQDKTLKNLLGSAITWDSVKDMKTAGILCEDREKGLMEIGVPMGVVAALIPSTNPTSTAMYKSIISLKAGNSIVISPHPGAKKCIVETVKIIQEAARRAGAPDGAVGCISLTTMEATNALLTHRDIGVILATGGEAMVRAAYSSGNPAIGVGPGNGPSFIERTADIPLAVKRIFDSKTFDNGTICASEQSIVTERCIAKQVEDEVLRQGGYFLTDEQSKKLSGFLLRANGTMNPKIVGKTAQVIADMAGISIPAGTRVLVSRQTEVSRQNPYSREKLCPVLAFYVEDGWESACERSIAILQNEGAGHTMTIHSQNMDVIREFALKKPVSRLLVNTPGALGGVGATTNLAPALTLGCGAVGGSATSDNITPLNLINIRRVAWGVRELEDLRGTVPAAKPTPSRPACAPTSPTPFTREDIEAITRAVIARLGGA